MQVGENTVASLPSSLFILLIHTPPLHLFFLEKQRLANQSQSFFYSSHGKTVTVHTPKNPIKETSEPKAGWEKKLAKHERKVNETWLVLTNTEYDCPIQDSCAVNQQIHSRAMPRVSTTWEAFSQGHNLEMPK